MGYPENYTVDYIMTKNSEWIGRLRADDTPDTIIETKPYVNWFDAVDEVHDLAGPDAAVNFGSVLLVTT